MNLLQRKIGVIVSFIVIGGISSVTLFQERNTTSPQLPTNTTLTDASTSNSTSATDSSVNSSNAVVAPKPAVKITTQRITKTTYVQKCTNTGDDDEGSCITVPVTTVVDAPSAPVTPAKSTVGTNPPQATVPKQYSSVYKNGTYTAVGTYDSPAGYEQISVTVTLVNDIITSSTVTPLAVNRQSLRYQNYFISGYQSYVIGQNIASVNLTYVSGSSLTPYGFDNALNTIMAQAKA